MSFRNAVRNLLSTKVMMTDSSLRFGMTRKNIRMIEISVKVKIKYKYTLREEE